MSQRMWNLLTNNKVSAALTIIGLLVGVGVFETQEREREHDQQQNALSGFIRNEASSRSLNILLGGVGITFNNPNSSSMLGAQQNIILDGDGTPLLSILLSKKGRLLVSAVFRDSQGNLLGELKDNEWSLGRGENFFDRNYTDNVLEVRGQDGEVALQVVDMGNYIFIAGRFGCRKGGMLTVREDESRPGALLTTTAKWMDLPPGPKSLCIYPAANHLGICPGAKQLPTVLTATWPDTHTALDFCNTPYVLQPKPSAR